MKIRKAILTLASVALLALFTSGCDTTAAPYVDGGLVRPAKWCPQPWKGPTPEYKDGRRY